MKRSSFLRALLGGALGIKAAPVVAETLGAQRLTPETRLEDIRDPKTRDEWATLYVDKRGDLVVRFPDGEIRTIGMA